MRTWPILIPLAIDIAMCQGVAGSCGWYLNPNDCICMNSVDGRVMAAETTGCCKEMGLKAANNVGRPFLSPAPISSVSND